MSKRPHEESKEDRWLRKLKKYEQKLKVKKRSGSRRVIYSDDEHDVQNQEHLESDVSPMFSPAHSESECAGENILPLTETDIYADTATVAAYAAPAALGPDVNPSLSPVDVAIADYDPDLLRELGDVETDPVEYGEDLQADVAARLQKILKSGLKKEAKDELLKKYPLPKNVPLAKAPTLNPEIGAMLVETCKLRDKRLSTQQDQLRKALSALGKALSDLLKKNPDIPDIIRTLNDASVMLADSHFAETDTRRSVVLPLIDKSLSEPFKDRKRDHYLFGENLGELVKDSRGIKKTGQLIQAVASSSSSLNVKGPSSRMRQQRSGKAYFHRAGGQRAVTTYTYPYPNRRQAAPPPPRLPGDSPRRRRHAVLRSGRRRSELRTVAQHRHATPGVFLFCWAPFFTCNVLDAICGKLGLPYSPGVTVFILTTWLGYINSFLNPVIYTIFNPEFRKAFRKILKCGT